ncbi:MAG: hypothetical protein JXR70_07150, partial [Spirochaetales bacterium]|nr:hypothetical protein [Spirochaetales bacterium]
MVNMTLGRIQLQQKNIPVDLIKVAYPRPLPRGRAGAGLSGALLRSESLWREIIAPPGFRGLFLK